MSGETCDVVLYLGSKNLRKKTEQDGIKLVHGVQSLKLGSTQRQHLGIKVELKLVENNTHTPSWRHKQERQNPVKQETEAAQVWGYK